MAKEEVAHNYTTNLQQTTLKISMRKYHQSLEMKDESLDRVENSVTKGEECVSMTEIVF